MTAGAAGATGSGSGRLHLVANHARFLVLDSARRPNLASRALGLRRRRRSQDLQNRHGDPVLLAEMFVDGSRFSGTCYRAANGRHLGSTSGFSRVRGAVPDWPYHGQPKAGFVSLRPPDAGGLLNAGRRPEECRRPGRPEPPGPTRLSSRYEHLSRTVDFRKARGLRYPVACYMAIAVAARQPGYRGVTAIGEFAAALTQEQRRAVGGFHRPSRGIYTVPTESTFRYFLSAMPPDSIEQAVRCWQRERGGQAPVALDGKTLRGAARQSGQSPFILVTAFEHGTGIALG